MEENMKIENEPMVDIGLFDLIDFSHFVQNDTRMQIVRMLERKQLDHALDTSCWVVCDYVKGLQFAIDAVIETVDTAKLSDK